MLKFFMRSTFGMVVLLFVGLAQTASAARIHDDSIGPIAVDSNVIAPGVTREIEVYYSASQDREVMVELWSNNPDHYRVVYFSVPAGRERLKVLIDVPEDIDRQYEYHWYSKIIPVGGQWWEYFDQLGTEAVIADNIDQPPFFDYPIYSFPDSEFTSTEENNIYLTRVGNNIIDGTPSIYSPSLYVEHKNDTGFVVSHTMDLVSGNLTKYYTQNDHDQTQEFINPYTDSNDVSEYLAGIETMISQLKRIVKKEPIMNDTLKYLVSVQKELEGRTVIPPHRSRLYFEFEPRIYDFTFTWKSDIHNPDILTAHTHGFEEGGPLPLGITVTSEPAYNPIKNVITLNFENGEIRKTISVNGNTTEEVQVHPYREEGGNLQRYLALLAELENKLRKLAEGTKVGDVVVSSPYLQMEEYADGVYGLLRKFTPIEIESDALYFGDAATVFDFHFIYPSAQKHHHRWEAKFTLNDASEWELEVIKAKSIPGRTIKTKLNLTSGELYIFDDKYYDPLDYTLFPPLQGEDVEPYRYALLLMVDIIAGMEELYGYYWRQVRPQPQLKATRDYLQNVADNL